MKKISKALKLLIKFAEKVYNCKYCNAPHKAVDPNEGFMCSQCGTINWLNRRKKKEEIKPIEQITPEPKPQKSINIDSPFPYVELGVDYIVSLVEPYHVIRLPIDFVPEILNKKLRNNLNKEDAEILLNNIISIYKSADKDLIKNIIMEGVNKNWTLNGIYETLLIHFERNGYSLFSEITNNIISIFLYSNKDQESQVLCSVPISPKDTPTDLSTLKKILRSGAFDFAKKGGMSPVGILARIKEII